MPWATENCTTVRDADPDVAAVEKEGIAGADLLIVVETLDAQVLGLRGIEATHVQRAVEADGLKPTVTPKASLAAVTALSSVRCAAAGRVTSNVIAKQQGRHPMHRKAHRFAFKWNFRVSPWND